MEADHHPSMLYHYMDLPASWVLGSQLLLFFLSHSCIHALMRTQGMWVTKYVSPFPGSKAHSGFTPPPSLNPKIPAGSLSQTLVLHYTTVHPGNLSPVVPPDSKVQVYFQIQLQEKEKKKGRKIGRREGNHSCIFKIQ